MKLLDVMIKGYRVQKQITIYLFLRASYIYFMH
jgi:hypothetical protein